MLEAFRPLNNRFGLAAGDVLVGDLAGLRKSAVVLDEHDAIISRFGDGVFVPPIWPDLPTARSATKLGEQDSAKPSASKPITPYLGQSLLTSNASIGIAAPGHDDHEGEMPWALISQADDACEKARREGGEPSDRQQPPTAG